MAFCPQCGAAANPGASFCASCGADIPAAPPAVAPAPAHSAAAAPASPVAPVAAMPPGLPGQRPVGVSIVGTVMLVFSALGVLGILMGMLFVMVGVAWASAFAGEWFPWLAGFGGLFAVLMLFALFVAFVVVALGIAAGWGALKGKPWAWGLTIVIMGLIGLNSLGGLMQRDGSGILGLMASVLVIWYFFQPDVKRWFGRAGT